ncbi:hypothetical protein ACFOWB_03075 [Chenggangzhangella methanolivorans]|uniref:hypothetical protein n=1 Tax=Chenggangzhangella methanolivorans TaxID=1437009 RepID=UPI00360C9EA3
MTEPFGQYGAGGGPIQIGAAANVAIMPALVVALVFPAREGVDHFDVGARRRPAGSRRGARRAPRAGREFVYLVGRLSDLPARKGSR